MDGFDQDLLVLELVTLGGKVEAVVLVSIDLLGLSIFSEQSSQDSLSSDPKDFLWHSGILGTSSLTDTSVSTLGLLFGMSSSSGSRVDDDLFSSDKVIVDQLSDGVSGVGQGNFVSFIGVQPQSVLSASQDGSSQSSLESQVNHFFSLLN